MTAPELLKAQMPLINTIKQNLLSHGYKEGTKEWFDAFDVELSFYRKFVALT